MKATGIVRKIDDMGRLVIPREIRRMLKVREYDQFEVYYDNDSVTFRKCCSPNTDSSADAKKGNQ